MIPTALVRYDPAEAAARSDRWASLSDEERHRAAALAASTHDADELWDLTQSWMIQYGRKGARLSPLTLTRYRRGVQVLLADWAQVDLLKPKRMDGSRWLRKLEASGLKPSTIGVLLASARALYAALREAGATAVDPFKDAHPAGDPVAAHEKRHPYTEDEIERLLAAATGDVRLIVLLGAYAGLRASEIVALRWRSVDLEGRYLTVEQGKGGRRRRVLMLRTLQEALAAIPETEREGVVLTLGGHREPLPRRRKALRLLHWLCTDAGVPRRGLHALRHRAGTMIYAATGDLQSAQRMLGHAQLQTTTVYAEWDDSKLREQIGDR